jgi:hypothetical protein
MSVAIDLAKPEPEPPTGGEAYTDLLYAVPPYTIILHNIHTFI